MGTLGLVTFLVASALATSALSAVLGMAGGIVLMALLPLVLSVPAAMVAHGAVQFCANGYRAWLLRGAIDRRILRGSAVGSVAAFALLSAVAMAITLSPQKAWVYVGLGLLPFVRLLPGYRGTLGIEARGRPFACGFVVTLVSLFTGVGGPLLDVFFVDSRLDRHGVVATKAAAQTVSHALKVAFFTVVPLSAGASLAPEEAAGLAWALPPAIAASFVGTRLGARALDKLSDAQFRSLTRRVVEIIGLVCLARGAFLLLA